MFLSVATLELNPIAFSESLSAESLGWEPGIEQPAPLIATGTATLHAATAEIRVEGHLQVELRLQCDRCLATVDQRIDTDFALEYEPLPEAAPGQEVEIHGQDIDVGFYDGGGLELNDVLREQVLLSLPTRTLCTPDCQGLCPVCGTNRNQERCECTPPVVDERWAALRNL